MFSADVFLANHDTPATLGTFAFCTRSVLKITFREPACPIYHAVCGSIRTQRDFPLTGYAWHQRKAFSLDEQVQWKSSTISAAQRCIAGRVGRNFKRPARLLNLYRQCLAIRTQPIDSRAFEIRSFD